MLNEKKNCKNFKNYFYFAFLRENVKWLSERYCSWRISSNARSLNQTEYCGFKWWEITRGITAKREIQLNTCFASGSITIPTASSSIKIVSKGWPIGSERNKYWKETLSTGFELHVIILDTCDQIYKFTKSTLGNLNFNFRGRLGVC